MRWITSMRPTQTVRSLTRRTVEVTSGSALGRQAFDELWIEQLAQTVPEQVEAENGDGDARARPEGQQGRLVQQRLRLAQHPTPGRRRWRCAEPEVAQARVSQNGHGERDGRLHDEH